MFDVAPGKEEEFRYLERSLALSDWLDRLIEVTEPPGQSEPAPALTGDPDAVSVSSRQRDSGRDAMWDRIYVDERLRELERERLASRPRGLRAAFASRLARLALALHREAATETALQPGAESPR